eukprot:COSAG01_NODE_14722_length_1418_cov_1.959060_1_plen_327_part_00
MHRGSSDEWIGATLGKLSASAAQALHRSGTIDQSTLQIAHQATEEVGPSLVPAQALHSAALALAPQIPKRRQQFYTRHMLWNVACQHFGSVAISELSQSVLAAANDTTAAVAHVNASVAALDSLFAAQRAAEGSGQWSGLFFGDRLPYTTLQSRRRSVLQYQAALLKLAAVFDSGKGYYSFYNYQKPALPNYPLFYHSSEFNVRNFVLMNCSSGMNTADGGSFRSASATITFLSTRCRAPGGTILPPGPGDDYPVGSGNLLPLETCKHLTAKYTTDGSSPAATTGRVMHYTGPVAITETTTVRALISVDGVDQSLVHNMTFIQTLD